MTVSYISIPPKKLPERKALGPFALPAAVMERAQSLNLGPAVQRQAVYLVDPDLNRPQKTGHFHCVKQLWRAGNHRLETVAPLRLDPAQKAQFPRMSFNPRGKPVGIHTSLDQETFAGEGSRSGHG